MLNRSHIGKLRVKKDKLYNNYSNYKKLSSQSVYKEECQTQIHSGRKCQTLDKVDWASFSVSTIEQSVWDL